VSETDRQWIEPGIVERLRRRRIVENPPRPVVWGNAYDTSGVEAERLDAALTIERLTFDRARDTARIDRMLMALRQIANLVDSEAGEPLDDAIRIANEAMRPTNA
jgi:hypothetical protein